MADKYIGLINDKKQQVEATVVGGTVAQAGDIVGLDSNGKIDPTLMPEGIGADILNVESGESLAIGDLVYIYDDTGTVKCGKAFADVGGNSAVGFVLEAKTAGETVNVYFEGKISGLTGLTVGARYYLSDSQSGKISLSGPVGTGKLHQFVGKAINNTTLSFEIDDEIILA